MSIKLKPKKMMRRSRSEKGTLIRIWDTATGKQIQELRRGADHAEIQSLCFSPKTSSYLAVSSDKGTIHIFKVKAGGKNGKNKDAKKGKGGQGGDNDDEQKLNDSNNASSTGKGGKDNKKNPVSALSAFKTVLPRYFSSEWSLAQFRVPDVRIFKIELYDIKRMSLIQAHEGSLGCFSLSFDGKLLATASEKGTLIRIWDTATGKQIQELRRGADHAEIQSLCFSPKTSSYLAVSSDKGTIHIFKVKKGGAQKNGKNANKAKAKDNDEEKQNDNQGSAAKPDSNSKKKNPVSALSAFKTVLPRYFSSEWSLAQFRVPDVRTIVAFGSDETTIVVVSSDGTFYKAKFDPVNGGDCQKLKDEQFLKSNDTDYNYSNQ
eukprot:CAMPEP_0201591910 /NCGR_PEP_ID=MMETSP0190_2-20130828/189950_1 /ASSEMBLY_ACC=CAM_ASM_000263 /TAXON_ID=37353 /ORGANISM="Rosalina sp." /LENGTH=374 /DNA_ID=CAMNT_0048050441 /DNA_START=805 /DNA_END=1930 /DNA_ORIENTATION=+